MKKMFFAGALALALGACGASTTEPQRYEVPVDYREPVGAVVVKLGLSTEEVPVFETMGLSENGTGEDFRWMRVVRAGELQNTYSSENGFHPADAREMLAFYAKHPEAVPEKGLCAPGDQLPLGEGMTGVPVITQAGRLGVFAHGCSKPGRRVLVVRDFTRSRP
ncbi:hypothetical protein KKD81_00175 [Patescibacteria group bacterium]|nr:hypothetical protein [Patescibacteria group bacterium]MBU2158670.1 hypothetical protein [Patescibacteria group bacterium]MBU2220335.1 hypothetical protein [Patescibacteria group bacterium]